MLWLAEWNGPSQPPYRSLCFKLSLKFITLLRNLFSCKWQWPFNKCRQPWKCDAHRKIEERGSTGTIKSSWQSQVHVLVTIHWPTVNYINSQSLSGQVCHIYKALNFSYQHYLFQFRWDQIPVSVYTPTLLQSLPSLSASWIHSHNI